MKKKPTGMKIHLFLIAHYDYTWFEAMAAMAQQNLGNPYIESWYIELDLATIKRSEIMNVAQFNRKETANIASEYRVIIRGFRLILCNPYVKSNHAFT